jgi:hypothetical protein
MKRRRRLNGPSIILLTVRPAGTSVTVTFYIIFMMVRQVSVPGHWAFYV